MKALREAAEYAIDSYINEWRSHNQKVRPMTTKKINKHRLSQEILGGETHISPDAFKSMNRRQKTNVLSNLPKEHRLRRNNLSDGDAYRGSHPAVAVSELIRHMDLEGVFGKAKDHNIRYNRDGTIAGASFETVGHTFNVDDFPVNSVPDDDDIPDYNHKIEIEGNGDWHVHRGVSDRKPEHVSSGTAKNLGKLLDTVHALGDSSHPDHLDYHRGTRLSPRDNYDDADYYSRRR